MTRSLSGGEDRRNASQTERICSQGGRAKERRANTSQGWLAVHLAGVSHGRVLERNTRLESHGADGKDLAQSSISSLVRSNPPI